MTRNAKRSSARAGWRPCSIWVILAPEIKTLKEGAMKAIHMTGYGGPEVLVYTDAPDPVSGVDDVVVDVHAASVNPVDWKIRQGGHRASSEITTPHILGVDFSGVVRTVGAGVKGFSAGDEVFGVCAQSRDGGYAEAVALDASQIALKPASLSHVEAASIALTGLTALYALDDYAQVKAGETVLIHAGAGGVGSFGIQYAKHVGATVWSTASAANHDYVRSLGADEVIDYNSQDFTEVAPMCDVVFDTIGGDVHERSFKILKEGGRFVYVSGPNAGFQPPAGVTYLRPKVDRDGAHMTHISELVAAGAVWPPEISIWKLEDAARAHEESATGHVKGKIVFKIR
ncbi:MAG: NADPH:quinone reductase-like Zn-dependent oxidoreductase [Alphaproteobacteria bacterium]